MVVSAYAHSTHPDARRGEQTARQTLPDGLPDAPRQPVGAWCGGVHTPRRKPWARPLGCLLARMRSSDHALTGCMMCWGCWGACQHAQPVPSTIRPSKVGARQHKTSSASPGPGLSLARAGLVQGKVERWRSLTEQHRGRVHVCVELGTCRQHAELDHRLALIAASFACFAEAASKLSLLWGSRAQEALVLLVEQQGFLVQSRHPCRKARQGCFVPCHGPIDLLSAQPGRGALCRAGGATGLHALQYMPDSLTCKVPCCLACMRGLLKLNSRASFPRQGKCDNRAPGAAVHGPAGISMRR
mmetsp:Transcript_8126/g.24522  ORF Transcript_8126/g.24522 Transcript_8126/m.24522 type:complete len:300 (+) Transcript_8126:2101-3000(+)